MIVGKVHLPVILANNRTKPHDTAIYWQKKFVARPMTAGRQKSLAIIGVATASALRVERFRIKQGINRRPKT